MHQSYSAAYFDTYSTHYFRTGTNSSASRAYINSTAIYSYGDVVAYASDRRLKTNIKGIVDNPLDILESLRGVRFTWNDKAVENKRGTEDIGFIAQEIEPHFPELITTIDQPDPEKGKDEHGNEIMKTYKTIRYDRMTAYLIETCKALLGRVKHLEDKVNKDG